MPDDKIRLLVTGLGGGSQGMQVVKAVRLSQLTYEITGTDIKETNYGIPFVDHWRSVPPADHANYLPELLALCREHKIQVLIPGSDPELKVISDNRTLFQDDDILLPLNPADLLTTCLDKLKTTNLLKQKGFAVPETTVVAAMSDVKNITQFPVICKPILGGGGSNNVFIAQDNDELDSLCGYLLGQLGSVLVQEYIGTVDHEYTVGVLTDLDGNQIDAIAVKRDIMSALSNRIKVPNRTGRTELGKMLAISSGVSQGRIGRFEKITNHCLKVAAAIGSRGPLNIQCRTAGDTIYIFEINPRFSGTAPLRAMAGFNEPDILIRTHLRGEKFGRVDYQEGLILRGLNEQMFDDA